MKSLIERLLTDESARDAGLDAQMAVAMSELFYPWSSSREMQ